MAARHPKPTMAFYVYEVTDASDSVIYVGKGSGNRMLVSAKARGGHSCREIARFKREADAYGFEVEKIAELSPALNKHRGGNGSKATRRAVRKTGFELMCARFGTRRVAAMILMRYRHMVDPSKVDAIRRVANG